MYEPVLVGEFTKGMQTNRKPFMVNQEAWPVLENAWNFRGRIRKKLGYRTKGRLRLEWSQVFILTSAGGNITIDLKALDFMNSEGTLEPGTVTVEDGTTTWNDDGTGTFTGGVGSLNYNTGVLTLDGTAASDIFVSFSLFQNLPVMGLRTRERVDVNDEQTIAFNTRHSFRFVNNQWECLPNTLTITGITTASPPEVTTSADHGMITGQLVNISSITGDATMQSELNGNTFMITVTSDTTFTLDNYTTTGTYTGGGSSQWCERWTGSDSQYFWTTNFENPGQTKQFWATNYDGRSFADNIKHYDGTRWQILRPALNGIESVDPPDRFLEAAKIIEPYKERLLTFYTVEEDPAAGNITFPQRIRWSEIGNVLDQTDGWRDDIEGRGGFLDIPTAESIVTVGFIRDRIIIYCDRSTWELMYTGNELDPFKLRKINVELGAESRFSRIQFDAGVLAIGNVGIHTCNGDSVERIDQEIPSFVFDINNDRDGIERVYGIRDYFNEIVMWSYPDSRTNTKWANRILVYNYRDNNWALWKDCFTCYGFFQRTNDRTWASYTDTTWGEADFTWKSGQGQAKYRQIVAGNQNGYVVSFFPETTTVVPSRYMTGYSKAGQNVFITIPDHCLEPGDYIKIEGALNSDGDVFDPLGDLTVTNPDNFVVRRVGVVDSDNVIVVNTENTTQFPTGISYQMLGELTKFDNVDMRTKFFTPFWKVGASMQLNHIDFNFDRTQRGELTYNVFIDDNDSISMSDPETNFGILGDNTVRTRPENDESLGFAKDSTWHRAFCFVDGQTIQLQLKMNDTQMKDESINQADVVLYAFILYIQRINTLT